MQSPVPRYLRTANGGTSARIAWRKIRKSGHPGTFHAKKCTESGGSFSSLCKANVKQKVSLAQQREAFRQRLDALRALVLMVS
jgi:hypothetical protein